MTPETTRAAKERSIDTIDDTARPTDRASTEVLVIGDGQAGLAARYYLRRAKVDFAILDAQPSPAPAARGGTAGTP